MMEETVLLQEPKPCVSVCLSSLCSPPPPHLSSLLIVLVTTECSRKDEGTCCHLSL